jgi:hypothetical protein
MSGFDDLLAEARQRLEAASEGDELGERVELRPGEHFHGRWRERVSMHTRDGDTIEVLGLWDDDGKARFHYENAALLEELADGEPGIGDEVVIIRGEDYSFEVAGETRTKYRYAIRWRPGSAPLPTTARENEASWDDDVPF